MIYQSDSKQFGDVLSDVLRSWVCKRVRKMLFASERRNGVESCAVEGECVADIYRTFASRIGLLEIDRIRKSCKLCSECFEMRKQEVRHRPSSSTARSVS
jgi:hypothetical protein